MNLDLKHLAAYLPYKLKTVNFNVGEFLTKPLISELIPSNITCFADGSTESKILLRPLSDIENEIEHNGKKVIVRNLIDDVRRFIDVYQYLDQSYDIELNYETSDYSVTIDFFEGYKIVQILLEYHFDVFGLIPAGLAIDINTLER